MGWPQIVMIVMMVLDVWYDLLHDGEPRDTQYCFIVTLLCNLFMAWILDQGGFWK